MFQARNSDFNILFDNTEIYCILCTFIGSVQLPFLVAMASLPVLVYPVNWGLVGLLCWW